MRGKRFQSKAKTVQKLGRDGLVEQNMATGEKKRVSQRTADLSFGPARPQEQAAGHRAAQRGGGDSASSNKKRRKQPRPIQQTAEEAVYAAQEPAGVPEAPVSDVSSMRMAADAPMMAAPIASKDPPPPPSASRRRRKRKNRKKTKRRQAVKHIPDAARPAAEPKPSRLMPDSGSRLHFEDLEVPPSDADTTQAERPEGERDTRQRDSPPADAPPPAPDDRGAYQKRQAAELSVHSATGKADRPRLRFEDSPPAADSAPAASPVPAPKEDASPSGRKYQKAVRRVERAEQEVEQARDALPTRLRLSFQPEPDGETGRPRHRLHFEQEVLPEYRKPSLPARGVGMAKTAAVMKFHGKIHQHEQDNVALEAAHKSELFMEQGVGRVLRWQRNRRRSKPYRVLRQAEQRTAKENVRLAWQTALRDNPELQRKNALAKWVQKQKIKRKYAQAAHKAKQTAQFTQNAVYATGQIVRAVQQYIAARKSLLLVMAMLAMVVMFFSAGMTSCTAMLSGLQSSYISATYMANEQDICNADLYYTEMETDLQIDIDKTEENYPGYDEYRCNIGEISHDPYELMDCLSTVFNAFTFEQVQGELVRLFGEQYTLTREVIVETRYDSDGDPYDWYILQTTLTVQPLSSIIAGSLSPGEQTDRYGLYMQTFGNRQAYGNPFDFPWLGYVSSSYGYRVHPISGEKDLHRGVDIAVAQGTPIRAIQDGRVVSAKNAGSYGLCVVIEDEKGYQSRYAHCSSLSVRAGQEVKRGDVIAAVGSTGNSTGPHLHLEIMLNGEYLNPYYFVDTGYDGSIAGAIPGAPGGPVIPDYPGEPPTDETYAAMLAEAEKYLGYPYVWGGSSPSTSFDCSGFVSWVINHSGWDVGRQTATGLFHLCTPVTPANAKPGDLIFFTKTYSTPKPVSHVGIYVGNGQMLHCGDPISYANINSN